MKKNADNGDSGNYKKAKIKINIITAVAAAAVLCGTIAGCITAIYHILANHYFKYSMYRLAAVILRDSLTKWIAYTLLFTAAIIVLLLIIKKLIKWFPSPGGILNNKALRQRVTTTALIMALCFTALNVYLYVDGKINTPKGPNIIIILSDALRRDHMGCYGYQRDTTPNIDSFAGQAVLFTHAFTQSPSTKPSIASLFTSLYPSQHNVVYNENTLLLSCLTMAEVLQENRYITAGFSENIQLSREFGYHQGFGQWQCGKVKRYQKSKDEFDNNILSWLDRCHKRPFFLYIHFLEPHAPYTPPPSFANFYDKSYKGIVNGHQVEDKYIPFYRENRRDLEHLVALYDEEIRFMDFRFGKIIKHLKKLNILDSSILIFLSDHGEEFLDHGDLKHSSSVYAELINMPLIIRYPELFTETKEKRPVQHIDIFPTLLSILKIELPNISLAGTDILQGTHNGSLSPGTLETKQKFFGGLRGAILQKSPPHRRRQGIIISEQLRRKGRHKPQRCIIYKEWKLIHGIDSNSYTLFNIDKDPGDTVDLAAKYPEIATELKFRLMRWQKSLTGILKPRRIKIEKEAQERLKSLGYIN